MDKRFTPEIIAAAQAAMIKWKVPASITLAQWAVESAYGTHMPAGSHNPFGIKAKAGEPFVGAMTWEHLGGRDIRLEQHFRKFASFAEAFEAHGKLLATSHYYVHAMAHVADPDAFAKALTGVYATDPHYGQTLSKMMKANGLYAFDKPPPKTAAAGPVDPDNPDPKGLT